MARKSNAELLASQKYSDTPRGRDVHEHQRLERGRMEDPQSMTSRLVLCVILAVLTFALVYGLWCGYSSFTEYMAAKSAYNAEQKALKEWQDAHPDGAVAVIGPDGQLYYEGEAPPEVTLTKPEGGFSARPRSLNHIFISLLASLGVYGAMYEVMKRQLQGQNMLRDMTDVNHWENDQHIALPSEIQKAYDWFPDAGAHSKIQVSSMLSHMMLQNKGLKRVKVAKRYKADVKDERGLVLHYKGEIVRDEDGNAVMIEKPIIDEAFGMDLFETSGCDPEFRTRYDASGIIYNPGGKNRDKLGDFRTVADLINADWYLPEYEPQRPAGGYIVDTAPVNTMV